MRPSVHQLDPKYTHLYVITSHMFTVQIMTLVYCFRLIDKVANWIQKSIELIYTSYYRVQFSYLLPSIVLSLIIFLEWRNSHSWTVAPHYPAFMMTLIQTTPAELLWRSDQPEATVCTIQNTTLSRDRHPWYRRDLNQHSQ